MLFFVAGWKCICSGKVSWRHSNTGLVCRQPGGSGRGVGQNLPYYGLLLQTEQIQAVIDKAAQEGGGVICIPQGTFLSGSLFFKPHTHLYLEKGAVLKGSDDISHFDVIDTRLEGQNLKYFAAHRGGRIYTFGRGKDKRERTSFLEIFLVASAGQSSMYESGGITSATGIYCRFKRRTVVWSQIGEFSFLDNPFIPVWEGEVAESFHFCSPFTGKSTEQWCYWYWCL